MPWNFSCGLVIVIVPGNLYPLKIYLSELERCILIGIKTLTIHYIASHTQCCGSGMVYPGSEFFPSRIRINEFKHFNPKKLFLSSRKYDPGCSSRIRILYPSRIPDPGVKKAPDSQHRLYLYLSFFFSPRYRALRASSGCGPSSPTRKWASWRRLSWRRSRKSAAFAALFYRQTFAPPPACSP